MKGLLGMAGVVQAGVGRESSREIDTARPPDGRPVRGERQAPGSEVA
jgi:hypothetical protein